MALTPEFAKVVRLCDDIQRKTNECKNYAQLGDYKSVENITADIELATQELAEFVLGDDARSLRESIEGPGDNVLDKQHDPVTPFTMLDKDAPERYKP